MAILISGNSYFGALLLSANNLQTRYVFIFFFFALMQKRNKKNQGKTSQPLVGTRFCLASASPCVASHFLLFIFLRDTLVSVTFRFLAGVLALFIQVYRCEI